MEVFEKLLGQKWWISGLLIGAYCILAVYFVINNFQKKKTKTEVERGLLESMLNAPTDPKYYGGKTDKYEWTQTETEVDVYVYVKEGTRGRDVQCLIGNEVLKLKAHGQFIINGALYEPVIPDESTWQIEKDPRLGTVVWISMVKKHKTERNQHWRCVVKGDPEIDTSKFGPPIRAIDASNPSSAFADLDNILKKKN